MRSVSWVFETAHFETVALVDTALAVRSTGVSSGLYCLLFPPGSRSSGSSEPHAVLDGPSVRRRVTRRAG